jgi:ribonuclease P/MRP protein subunit POP8
MGTAISIDILKIETLSTNVFLWIRVPREDAAAVVGAVSSWIGGTASSGGASNVAWRVCAKGNFLGAIVHGSGGELFQS